MREHELPFPVVTFPHRRWAELYRMRGVPTVLFATPEGRVMQAWTRPMDEPEGLREILDAVEQAGLAASRTESIDSPQVQPQTGGVP
jgi:hypothetical protein